MDLLLESDSYEKRPLPQPEPRMSELGPLPQPEPRYRPPAQPAAGKEDGQAWLRLIALAVVAAAIIFLLVLLARWIYHEVHNNSAPVTTSSSGAPAKPAGPAKTSGRSPAKPKAASKSTPPASNSHLTNTGPGNIAAVFAGASLAAAGLHYIISIRRFNRGRS